MWGKTDWITLQIKLKHLRVIEVKRLQINCSDFWGCVAANLNVPIFNLKIRNQKRFVPLSGTCTRDGSRDGYLCQSSNDKAIQKKLIPLLRMKSWINK
jgi:hypothetical protein